MKLKFHFPDLVLNIAGLLLLGLIALASTAHGEFLWKQIIYIVTGVIFVTFIYRVCKLEFFQKNAFGIYVFNILLLILLKFFGTSVLGAQRWIKLGPISVQPSEIAKVCLIICLAVWLSRRPVQSLKDIFEALLLVSIPALFVLIQPDLGTTLVYIAISFGMLYWAGASLTDLLIISSPLFTAILSSIGHKIYHYHHGHIDFALTLPLVFFFLILYFLASSKYKISKSKWNALLLFFLSVFNCVVMIFRSFAWSLLKDYQQKRLTIFLDPYVDPLGSGYHIIQSIYAIGSGGFLGKGPGAGDLTQGQFVPEQHTDFIFSAIGEEYGFIGAIIVIFLYGLLLLKIIQRAANATNRFSSLLAIGTFSMMFFHIFVNIGMTLSIMPITGVPLPFLSYGGSSLFVNLFLISLVLKGEQRQAW